MSIVNRLLVLPVSLTLSVTLMLAQHGSPGGGAGHAGGGAHAGGMHAQAHTAQARAAQPNTTQAFAPAPYRAVVSPYPAAAPGLPSASAYASAAGGNPAYRQPVVGGRVGRAGRYNRHGNYAYPYGYLAAPYYPLWGFGDDSDYSNQPAYSSDYQPAGPEPDPDAAALGQQLAHLSAQVNDLQNQIGQNQAGQNQREGFPNAPEANVPQASAPQDPAPPSPPLTVILTSGQTLHVQNYAVMGNVFWDFSAQPVRKIPLSKIDVPASTKATEATGAEFPPLNDLAKASSE